MIALTCTIFCRHLHLRPWLRLDWLEIPACTWWRLSSCLLALLPIEITWSGLVMWHSMLLTTDNMLRCWTAQSSHIEIHGYSRTGTDPMTTLTLLDMILLLLSLSSSILWLCMARSVQISHLALSCALNSTMIECEIKFSSCILKWSSLPQLLATISFATLITIQLLATYGNYSKGKTKCMG